MALQVQLLSCRHLADDNFRNVRPIVCGARDREEESRRAIAYYIVVRVTKTCPIVLTVQLHTEERPLCLGFYIPILIVGT